MPGATDSPFGSLNGFAPDVEDGSGLFFTDSVDLTGYGGSISAWTEDGMLLTQIYPDSYVGQMGWPDRIYSLSVLRMPGDPSGTRRFCMEDDGASRICLATLTNVETAQMPRTSHLATWPPVPHEQVVELHAVAPVAHQQDKAPGGFRFVRIGDNGRELKVKYSVSGSAIPGKDYAAKLSGEIVIPAGRTSADLVITPVNRQEIVGDCAVKLTVAAAVSAYTVSSSSEAEIRIADPSNCPKISVAATTVNALKGVRNGNFRITRNAPGARLKVYYQLAGTAIARQDFAPLPNSAEIPDGAESIDVPIVGKLDSPNQPNRDVTLTLLPNRAGYVLDDSSGKAITDTVMIANAGFKSTPQIAWNFGVETWNPNPTMHNPLLAVSALTAGATSITPRQDEHGFYASLNGWDVHRQSFKFSLTVEPGHVLSLTDWAMRWAAPSTPGTLSLVIDNKVVATASYPASDRLPAQAHRYEMKQVVLNPGEHIVKILCTLPQGPTALLDDLTFEGTLAPLPEPSARLAR